MQEKRDESQKTNLVDHYSGIGIAAVAASVRFHETQPDETEKERKNQTRVQTRLESPES